MTTRQTAKPKAKSMNNHLPLLSRMSIKDKILKVAPDFKDSFGKVQVKYVAESVFGSDRKAYRIAVNKVLDDAGIARRRKLKPELPPAQGFIKIENPNPVSKAADSLNSTDVVLYVAIRAMAGSKEAFSLLQKLV